MLALACAISWTGCYRTWQFYTECSEPEEHEETIPPCPEAGVDDAGLDGDAEAVDAPGE
jgi:hypothetical protein